MIALLVVALVAPAIARGWLTAVVLIGLVVTGIEVVRAIANAKRRTPTRGGGLVRRPQLKRDVLPIPDSTPVGLTTYDAKDPETSFPPIEPLRPPGGAPNVLVVLHRRRRLRRVERVRRAVRTPNAERLAAERAEVHPLPHHGALLADPGGAADAAATTTPWAWAASPRSRPRRPGTTRSGRTPARRSREMLKLNGYSTAQFGKCHEVPVWETSPMGPFDALADRGSGFEYFYGFIGGETQPVVPGHLRGHDPGRAREDARGGLPLHGRHDGQGDQVGAPAEGADAGQAVLRLLRAGRDARPAPRRPPSGPTSTRGVRRRLGRAARARPSPARRSSA